jgi:hypothetical protein
MKKNLLLFIAGFVGFVAGRIGHYFGGSDNGIFSKLNVHHWIYGLIIIVLVIIIKFKNSKYITAFGIGVFVSDLNDFLNFRFIGSSPADLNPIKNFWSID